MEQYNCFGQSLVQNEIIILIAHFAKQQRTYMYNVQTFFRTFQKFAFR